MGWGLFHRSYFIHYQHIPGGGVSFQTLCPEIFTYQIQLSHNYSHKISNIIFTLKLCIIQLMRNNILWISLLAQAPNRSKEPKISPMKIRRKTSSSGPDFLQWQGYMTNNQKHYQQIKIKSSWGLSHIQSAETKNFVLKRVDSYMALLNTLCHTYHQPTGHIFAVTHPFKLNAGHYPFSAMSEDTKRHNLKLNAIFKFLNNSST